MTIFATDAPMGDCEAPEGGFPQRFPLSRGGLRPFASGNIGGRGAAADRDRQGGAVTRDL